MRGTDGWLEPGHNARACRCAIGLKVLTQAIDTTTSGERCVFHGVAAVAEPALELTLARTHARLGPENALGRGGGDKPPMGPAEINSAKGIVADSTITVEEIAQQVDVQPPTIHRHLTGGRRSLAQAANI